MNLKTRYLDFCFPGKKIGYILLIKSSGRKNSISYKSWHIQKSFLGSPSK